MTLEVHFSHGIEQELQVVDPETGMLRKKVRDVLKRVKGGWSEFIIKDFYDTQLEYRTGISNDLDQIIEGLPLLRDVAYEAAEEINLELIASGVNPVSPSHESENFGEHHHIGISTYKEQGRVHNLIREFTPELMALTVNSPIYESRLAGFKSLRSFRSHHIKYARRISYASLLNYTESSLLEKYGGNPRFWDVTPYASEGKSTVEVRLFDTQTSIDLSLAIVILLESIALKAKKFNAKDKPPPMTDAAILKHNRKQAIFYGLDANFFTDNNVRYLKRGEKFSIHWQGPKKQKMKVSAQVAIKKLLEYVEDEIEEFGADRRLLDPINKMLLHKETSADLQIAAFESSSIRDYAKQMMKWTKSKIMPF